MKFWALATPTRDETLVTALKRKLVLQKLSALNAKVSSQFLNISFSKLI
jgi:hypothetical protein